MQKSGFGVRPVSIAKHKKSGKKWSAQDVQKIKIYSMAQKVPRQWKKFLSCGENKEELMKFIYSFG